MYESHLTFGISSVGCVMRSDLVDTQSCREPDPAVESRRLYQRPSSILDHLRDICHAHSWLDRPPGVTPNLSMDFTCSPDVLIVGGRITLC